MSKKARTDALKSLRSSIAEIKQHEDTNTSSSQEMVTKSISRRVSNIPWYPKSAKLKKELKLLALHEESSLTALIDEGIRLVLQKRGKNMDDYL